MTAMTMASFISCTTRRGLLFADGESDEKYDISMRRLRDASGKLVSRIRPYPIPEDSKLLLPLIA
jgi:hypothetical protein